MRARAVLFRAVAVVLVAGQVLPSVPLSAQTRDDTRRTNSPPPSVKVNRTLPKTQPAPAFPVFSSPPTDGEIFRARVFDEPLVAIGGNTAASENDALGKALMTYLQGGSGEKVRALVGFLEAHPTSAWRGSLLTNLGIVYRRTGYFTEALSAWEEAWSLTKSATEPNAKATADRALAELAELNARLGRYERLEELFREIADREVVGGAKEKLTGAREGLWLMRNKPENAFRCGPMALDRILASSQPGYRTGDRILQSRSTLRGTSLVAMQALAGELGLKMQMARREAGAAVLVPAMVHWKAGHFAALVRADSGRYLMQDPTFGDELWVSQAALDEEASGYALVPEGKLPAGWRAVGAEEGGQVWGKGATTGFNQGATTTTSLTTTPSCSTGPMTVHSIHLLLVSLHLTDTPVGYSPPRGPSVRFQVTFNQREAFQPQIFSFSNFGPRWTYDWLSYVEDDPADPAQPVRVFVRGGGSEVSSGYVTATQSYALQPESQAVVVRTSVSPIRYERRLPDGSVEVFAQADAAASVPRRVFMTESIDPQGNALGFVYDASLRLVAVQDAIGQVTTLSYGNASDLLKITKVTDPFERVATFQYDAAGRLVKITDVIGITSEFTYESGDFIKTLTTPYGTSNFRMGEEGQRRWLEATDPLGEPSEWSSAMRPRGSRSAILLRPCP